MLHRIARLVALLAAFMLALPAQARVTITFWSYEKSGRFPHSFFTIHGTLDRGGQPVRVTYGFSPVSVTPAMLIGTVKGQVHETTKSYVIDGIAHFSTTISDAQFDSVMRLTRDWGPQGDSKYNLNRRNCVHFTAEAMRRAGLKVVEDKKLMKKPRSFTRSIAAINGGRITVYDRQGGTHVAAYPVLAGIGK